MPERIVAAAAGGMDPRNLPPELKVHFCGDVRIDDCGVSLAAGPWMKLSVPSEGGDEFELPAMSFETRDREEFEDRLEREQSTLRCILFEADQVHREEEPEPAEDYAMQAQALMMSGWFMGARVREALVVRAYETTGTTGIRELQPPRTSYEAATRLVRWLGYDRLELTPPEAIYLWAVDNGVADGLPDCYRFPLLPPLEDAE